LSSRRLLPALLLLFIGSGCAALIYEVVWFQLLELVIGASAVSMGVLLGTFMGGMCIGSLLLPRIISPTVHPLRVYAWLELGIGAMGLLILFGMPLLGIAKRRLADTLGSVATRGEGTQNLLCAYLAGAVLLGLLGNTLFGLWWLDPVAALVVAAVAVREGVESWRGKGCADCC